MFDAFEVIGDFLAKGGQVLWVIFFTTLVLWALIIERLMFFKAECRGVANGIIEKWKARADKSSWDAHRIREANISLFSEKVQKNIPYIKGLVALCPLLGLLGTVTGMIAVFDVMAIMGTGNARMMASGISMATIPTMAGMVASLSGLFFGTQLEKRAKSEKEKLAESLIFQ